MRWEWWRVVCPFCGGYFDKNIQPEKLCWTCGVNYLEGKFYRKLKVRAGYDVKWVDIPEGILLVIKDFEEGL